MAQKDLATNIPAQTLEQAWQTDATIEERRANYAALLCRYSSLILSILAAGVFSLWLFFLRDYIQILGYIISAAFTVAVMWFYPVIVQRGHQKIGITVALFTMWMFLFLSPFWVPSFLLGGVIGLIIVILMGILVLGPRGSLWLTILSLGGVLIMQLLVFAWKPDWFTPLPYLFEVIASLGANIAALLTLVIILRMIILDQYKQFRQLLAASQQIEAQSAMHQAQRSALEDANAVIEERVAAEREQREMLEALITQAREVAVELNSASSEILAATSQQMATTTEQSVSITQTAATLEEVRSTIQQTSEQAIMVAAATDESTQIAIEGQSAITDAVAGMQTVDERVEDIAHTILELSSRTQLIGEIIASVSDIADQSKLLALNASIEAARAGEEGRGFAVVAMEVRTLAEQSQQATQRIAEILGEIQQQTNTAVMVTEEGSKGAAVGVELVERAGAVIDQLAAVMYESSQAVAQIAASTGQQLHGIEQLSAAMTAIRQASEESAHSTRQTETSAQTLNTMAHQMQAMVAQHQG